MDIQGDKPKEIVAILCNCYIISKYSNYDKILSNKKSLLKIVHEVIDEGFNKLLSGAHLSKISEERVNVLQALRKSAEGVSSVETLRDNFLDCVRDVWPMVINRSIPTLKDRVRFGFQDQSR